MSALPAASRVLQSFEWFTFGSGGSGTLAHKDFNDLHLPKRVEFADKGLRPLPNMLSTGGCHALALGLGIHQCLVLSSVKCANQSCVCQTVIDPVC